ncbi:SUGP2 protein, partial [Sakesphorus luctuosus]|nr:SUGP2 protein [Sakesphorus luctuosus]
MASRRVPRDTFGAAGQERAQRYRLEASGQERFKAPSRPIPRPRYDEGRYPHDNPQHHPHEEWAEDPQEDYPGPSYRPASPFLHKDNYYHDHYGHPAPRDREFNREYGHPPSQNREYGHPPSQNREYGHPPSQNREYGHPASRDREYRHPTSHERDYGEQDYGPPDSWEAATGAHEPDFSSSEILGDFRSPGLMDEEYGNVENQEYDVEFGVQDGEFRAPMWRGGLGRGRVLRGKRLTRGVVKAKMFKGDIKTPLKKWDMKKPQPGLDPKPPEQPLEGAERANQRPVPVTRPALAAQRPILRLPKPAHVLRNLSFDLVDKSDIFSTFGMEIIKWAGFHAIKNDAEFSRLFGALFELETETCAKMLASFKCSLRPEHRDYCFFTIKSLQHAALKTPKVDNEFLNMLLAKGAVKTKNCFFEVIKPFDKYIMRLQDRLLKGVTPLLMACNAYELSIKTSGFGNPREMASAFETTVSLCRKSLALLGQTFALASVFRQEKILEAVGLQEMAPAPALFPNFDDSMLFGREYIENLKAWLDKSGYPIQVKKPGAEATEQLQTPSADPQGKREGTALRWKVARAPQRADRRVVQTIEQLVSSIMAGTVSAKDRSAQKSCPEYWFLSDEDSLEYKYYRLKLAEMQRRKEEGGEGRTPGEAAPESLRALLYARKVASIKRRLFKRRRPGVLPRGGTRGRKVRRATIGTQTVLSAGTVLKHQDKHLSGPAQGKVSMSQKNPPLGTSLSPPDAPSPEASLPAEDRAQPEDVAAPPELFPALASQFPDVDAKTMETAEKLAKFVAQVGPEIEQFSIDNSADNPDLWFLQDQTSSAFKFYRMKVYELCPSINFSAVSEAADAGEGAKAGERNLEVSEEEEEEEEDEEEEDNEEDAEFEEDISQAVAEEGDEEDVAAGRGEGQLPSPSDGAVPTLSTQAPPPAPGTPFPRKRVSSKSLKVGMIPASKRICLIEEPKVHEPVRIAYDRPRGCPVTKKKKKPKELEFSHKRLTPRNVGFQMLQRMGWQEGHGLGTRGRGIREPVPVGATSAGEGLGVAGEDNKEDAFDVFRQRMIQMYRQKRASK